MRFTHLRAKKAIQQAATEALADMFRNEGPINFNTDGQYFVSAAEEIGEQEAHP